jgi:hypothetical protein
MSEKRKIVLLVSVISVLLTVTAWSGAVAAQKSGQVPPPNEKSGAIVAGEAAAKQLLLLMDTDKNGKVSKQEWMRFMEAEFDRLDKNKDGELDLRELEKSQVRQVPFYRAGK